VAISIITYDDIIIMGSSQNHHPLPQVLSRPFKNGLPMPVGKVLDRRLEMLARFVSFPFFFPSASTVSVGMSPQFTWEK
jgi:hypothetical protein